MCCSPHRSFAWVYENRLGLRACTLLAILLRDIWKTWRPKSIRPTNILQAWTTRELGDIVDNFTNHFKREKSKTPRKEPGDSEDEWEEDGDEEEDS